MQYTIILYIYEYILYSRCETCDALLHVWKDLANTLNKSEDEAVAVSKVDCSVETDLCTGEGLFLEFLDN